MLSGKKHCEIVMPLAKLKIKEKGHIDYLQTKDPAQMHKLMSIGAIPGVSIILLQRFPSYVFKIGQAQFAVDKELAAAIYVRLNKI
ncbi:MAG: FeoA family protein [Candidatus Omnitrophota bacterium]|jgi:DtxR family Mn-dependent transcriptional regulator